MEGISLKVSLARRQPVIDPINDASSSATWSTIAASHSQKGSHKDKRDLVAYDEEMFWSDDMYNIIVIHGEILYTLVQGTRDVTTLLILVSRSK